MLDKKEDNIERAIEARAYTFIYKLPEFVHEILSATGKQTPKSMAEAMRDPEFSDELATLMFWALKTSKNAKEVKREKEVI